MLPPSSSSPDIFSIRQLLHLNISRDLIGHLVDHVANAVDNGLGRPSSSHGRGRAAWRSSEREDFAAFVTDVIRKAEIQMPVILGALVYIDRAMPHLRIAITDWAHHRVFMGALILAHKYLNDSSLKNVHWALCTGIFGKRDIGRIEREFLDVLDFELGIQEPDLMQHHAAMMALHRPRFRADLSHSPVRHVKRHRHDLPRLDRRESSPASSSDSASPCTPLLNLPYASASVAPSPCAGSGFFLIPSPQRPAVRPPRDEQLSAAMHFLDQFPMPHQAELGDHSPLAKHPHPPRHHVLLAPPPPQLQSHHYAASPFYPHSTPVKSVPFCLSAMHCVPAPMSVEVAQYQDTSLAI